jgi:large subunit ribosomal protein L24
MKIKKGDKVMVIAGKDRGTAGSVARVLPKDNLVLIEGVNMQKKHRRPTSRSRSGQVIDKAMPIHVSNVQLIDPKSGKPTRVGITREKDGTRTRVATKSGATL